MACLFLSTLAMMGPRRVSNWIESSGLADSRSDCFIVSDYVGYQTLDGVLNGLLGGHSPGYRKWVMNSHAYRMAFAPNQPAELVAVESCELPFGESGVLDGTQVDQTIMTSRGKVTVDLQPDRGRAATSRVWVRVPWQGDFKVPDALAEKFGDFSVALLYDAEVLLHSEYSYEPGDGYLIRYDAYDYRNGTVRRYHVTFDDLHRADRRKTAPITGEELQSGAMVERR